jgi:flavin reductase (DIM6/NTAB) family NADH-FMN oxidoreductase RutF
MATDYAGIVSGKDHNKFEQAKLTAVKAEFVNAPFVGEAPVIAECELYKSLELGTHTLFVGKILDIKIEEGLKLTNGGLDIEKVDPIIFNIGGDYHKVGLPISRAFSIGKSIK